MNTASEYSLVIPNELAALRKMSAWLQSALAEMNMNDEVRYGFDLCANEAVSNVINYAYPNGGTHHIALRLARNAQRLSLEIRDDGLPYNPLTRPKQPTPAGIDQARIGGLGVDLIREYMDECDYQREAGSNILTLTVKVG